MQQPKTIYFYPNGHVSVLNQDGENIPELQEKGWMQLFFEYLEQKGMDPAAIEFRAMKHDHWMIIKPFRTDYGWNINIS